VAVGWLVGRRKRRSQSQKKLAILYRKRLSFSAETRRTRIHEVKFKMRMLNANPAFLPPRLHQLNIGVGPARALL
jgi:hypothetical protein